MGTLPLVAEQRKCVGERDAELSYRITIDESYPVGDGRSITCEISYFESGRSDGTPYVGGCRRVFYLAQRTFSFVALFQLGTFRWVAEGTVAQEAPVVMSRWRRRRGARR